MKFKIFLLITFVTIFLTQAQNNWSSWQRVECGHGLLLKYRKGDYNEYAKKWYWYVRFKNPTNSEIHFSYGGGRYRDKGNIPLKERTHIKPSKESQSWFLIDDANAVWFPVNKVKIGDSSNYIDCFGNPVDYNGNSISNNNDNADNGDGNDSSDNWNNNNDYNNDGTDNEDGTNNNDNWDNNDNNNQQNNVNRSKNKVDSKKKKKSGGVNLKVYNHPGGINPNDVTVHKNAGGLLKKDKPSNYKKPKEVIDKPIYSGDDWGIKPPVSKIVITKTEVKPSKTALAIQRQREQGLKYQQEQLELKREKQEQQRLYKLQKQKEEQEWIELQRQKKIQFDKEQAEKQRKRLQQQQQNFDAQIKAINKAGNYLTSSIDNIFQQNNSYNNYKENIKQVTTIRKSDNPSEIISEFNRKLQDLERISQQRYDQRIKEINSTYALQSSTNNTKMEQLGTDLGTAIVKMSLPKQIAKEKAKAKRELEDEKRRMLTKIKNNIVSDFEENKNSYHIKAAGDLSIENENYYKNMADFYQCKIDKVESRFSINDTDWVDPECEKVSGTYSEITNKPSAEQLYKASLRKYSNSNDYYQKASKAFIEMAINTNPKNGDYYLHRAKFEELGAPAQIDFLSKSLQLKPKSKEIKSFLLKSLAEKKRIDETTFFDENWKITKRKKATYYRPLVGMENGLFNVRDYYSSNNQLQMKGYANKIDDNGIPSFVGEVIYYYESGEIDSKEYYNNGALKQLLNSNKNGYTSLGFYDGKTKPIYLNENYGEIEEIKYSSKGFINNLKWNYTRSYKKKHYQYLSFSFDTYGNLLFRDILNANNKIKERKAEDRIDALHAASKSYIDNKQYKEAIKFLENGVVLYPIDALIHYYLGVAKSRVESLLSTLNSSISKNINVTLSSKISKNNQEAIDYFNEGINLVLDDKALELKFYNELGNLYYKLGDFNHSAEIFIRALDIQPENPILLNSYSRSLAFSTSQLDKAKEMIELCNKIQPNKYDYQDTYAWVLYKKGDFKEANSWLDKALNNGGDSEAIIWEHKGDVLYKLGEKEKGIEHWLKAKQVSKSNGSGVSSLLNMKIKKKILLE